MKSTISLMKRKKVGIVTRILSAIFVAGICLIILELMLRIFNYGYDTSYVVERTSSPGAKAILNPCALLPYIGLSGVYSNIEPFLNIPVEKPANNLRVVVLGGSAVHGSYHNIGLNFPRYLQAMLESRFPETKIDVVNLSYAGLNSSAMTRLVKDALLLKPDVVVLYQAGNDLGRLLVMQQGGAASRGCFLGWRDCLCA